MTNDPLNEFACSDNLDHKNDQEAKSGQYEKIDQTKRPEKDRYYLNIAKEVASRARCFRSHFGAIIVLNDQIVSTGYVGAPRKTKDCIDRGHCLRDVMKIPSGHRYEICRSVHSEQNCIINAARAGVSVFGGDMYMVGLKVSSGVKEPIDSNPCFICKKTIMNAGLKRVISSTSDGGYKIYHIDDWINEWKIKDMIDDKDVYNANHRPPNEENVNKIIRKINNGE
jgi:dCMP deaminase